MNIFHSKKFRYGSVSLAFTIIIIAAVILFNAIFTALSRKFVWYIDMTSEQVYTLSDEAVKLLDDNYLNIYTPCAGGTIAQEGATYYEALRDVENQNVTDYREVTGLTPGVSDVSRYYYLRHSPDVTFIFCSDKDVLEANTSQRYALYTVLELVKRYDNIHVKYVDVYTNPSEVLKYKETSGQDINSQSVIITSGTESRVYTLSALYTYDSAGQNIIGYNGEQRLISGILAVTRAESPVVCVTYNHGESDSLTADSTILNVLYETGYTVRQIDLTKDDIPADCRLVLVFNPQSDFQVKNEYSTVSELEKLDRYLDNNNALMVFVDYKTPVLPNFEDFLNEWGIKIARSGETPYLIKDTDASLSAGGYNVKGTYTTGGLGASITAQLRRAEHPKPVLFPQATALVNPDAYEEIYDEDKDVWSCTYFKNGILRDSYDVFLSTSGAVAEAGGKTVAKASELGNEQAFSYMKVTCETKSPASGDTTYAYVMAVASTQFASASALNNSGYGNHAVVTYACNVLGRAVISVTLDCKYFTDTEIDSITSKAANQYTIVLTVVPAAIIFLAGTFVIIRRKYA